MITEQVIESIPEELKRLPRWVCYILKPPEKEGEKPRKVPLDPVTGKNAQSNNPSTWADFETAVSSANQYSYAGLGFMFVPEDGLVGVDVDHCYDPKTGVFNDTAKAIMDRQPTYMEFSPSGEGIHLLYVGTKPEGASKNSATGVEMYDRARYFTVTGNKVEGSLDGIAEAAPDTLPWIHECYVAKPKKPKKPRKKKTGRYEKLSDEEVLERAFASNGKKFARLWNGEWQKDYESQSEADMALIMILAFWTNKDADQMDRLFRASKLFRSKWDEKHHADGSTYGEKTLAVALENTGTTYISSGDLPIFEYEGHYCRTNGDSVYTLTNFIIRPKEMIKTEDEVQLTCDFVTAGEEVVPMTFMTSVFDNAQKFKSLLNRRTISLSFTGSDVDLELLKVYIASMDWKVKIGVKAVGIHRLKEGYVFVAGEGSVDRDWNTVDSIMQMDKYRSIQTRLLQAKELPKERMIELGQWLLTYNEPAKTVPILAWTAACFLKEYLRMQGIKFPMLALIGEAGSGKSTTLERVILPIFRNDQVTAAAQVTAFTLMKESSSSNTIPFSMDEFKPSKIDGYRKNSLYNHFRDSYDGHDGLRGRADQTIMTYQLLAPLLIAGEESADEAAIRERSIELLFMKKDIRSPSYRRAFNALQMAADDLGSLGRQILTAALSTSSEEAVLWHKGAKGMLKKELPSRVINNLSCCVAGLNLLERVCQRYQLSWSEVFPIDQKACIRYLEYSVQEYLLDGGESNRSVVEQTLEVMARMGLQSGQDYILSEDRKSLFLRLTPVYDQYTKYRREYAVAGEVLPYNQFRKQLLHSDILIQANLQKKFSGQNARCFELDYQLLCRRCDVSGFETDEPQPLT